MKSLKFVLPCALALFAAAPATAAATPFGCRSLNDAYSLAGMSPRSYLAHSYRAQLRADGRCSNLPAGRIVVDDKIIGTVMTSSSGHVYGGGVYACVRPRGAAYCLWSSQ